MASKNNAKTGDEGKAYDKGTKHVSKKKKSKKKSEQVRTERHESRYDFVRHTHDTRQTRQHHMHLTSDPHNTDGLAMIDETVDEDVVGTVG